jgi:hypothetical protein
MLECFDDARFTRAFMPVFDALSAHDKVAFRRNPRAVAGLI